MKVVFAGGGTGGHINPAISVANYIKSKEENFEALFIGTKRGLETRLVPNAGYNIEYIDICGFDRKNMIKNIAVVKKLIKADHDCVKLMKEFKPDAVVCTGGYVSGPVALAAHKLGIPSLIHEQNVYPGLTVKGAEKYVNYVAVSFPETVNHMKMPEKCVVTGNPIRAELLKTDYVSARKKLGLSDKPFVLVFGGSLGAEKLNNAMIDVIKKIGKDTSIQLLFGTGDRNYEKVQSALKGVGYSECIKVVPYINNMSVAMAAADLVISRSGAITLSEIAALGKASVLVPSPNVVRNHQEQNAREFERIGGAAVVLDSELSGDLMYEKIMSMTADRDMLKKMSENVKKLAKVDALEEIYRLVKKMQK